MFFGGSLLDKVEYVDMPFHDFAQFSRNCKVTIYGYQQTEIFYNSAAVISYQFLGKFENEKAFLYRTLLYITEIPTLERI